MNWNNIKTMKTKIIQEIRNGNIREALELMGTYSSDKYFQKDLSMQTSAFNRLDRDIRMGIVSRENSGIEMNRISHALISMMGGDTEEVIKSKSSVSFSPNDNVEQGLNDIITKSKRSNSDIYEMAKDLLSKLSRYKLEKAENPSYDINKRRIRAIYSSYNNLKRIFQESKEDSLEGFIEKVNQLLKEAAPTYEKLEEAHKLVISKGFKSELVSNIMEAKPDNEDSRITVAEQIEIFLSTLKV